MVIITEIVMSIRIIRSMKMIMTMKIIIKELVISMIIIVMIIIRIQNASVNNWKWMIIINDNNNDKDIEYHKNNLHRIIMINPYYTYPQSETRKYLQKIEHKKNPTLKATEWQLSLSPVARPPSINKRLKGPQKTEKMKT